MKCHDCEHYQSFCADGMGLCMKGYVFPSAGYVVTGADECNYTFLVNERKRALAGQKGKVKKQNMRF